MRRLRTGLLLFVLLLVFSPFITVESAAQTVNRDLPIRRASYWGGTGADSVNAVEVLPDSTLIIAGSAPNYGIGVPASRPLGLNGRGLIARYNSKGNQPLSAARLPKPVLDLEANASGNMVACGAFGVVVLPTDLSAPVWSRTDIGAVSRCALADDGTVAALGGGQVRVFNGAGADLGSWSPGGVVNDVAVGGSAAARVFEVGYTQATSTLQIAYLRGRNTSGAVQWTGWAFSASAVQTANLGADSRAERVSFGLDGSLYVSGYTDGGNSIFGRDPQDIGVTLPGTILVKTDNYNNPFNISGAKALGWYGRFNPSNGTLLKGQWLLTRLSDGKGNSVGIRAIEADANGEVFIVGEAYATLDRRNSRRVAGLRVGAYSGGEPFFLHISADFSQRLYWTTFTLRGKTAGGSPATAIATRNGVWLMGANLNLGGGQRLITVLPRQATPGGGTQDGYWAVRTYTPTLLGLPTGE